MAVCFCAAAYLFLQQYLSYKEQTEELAAVSRQHKMMSDKYQELVRKQHLIDEMDLFVTKVEAAGLTPDKWSSYGIDIEKSVSYELARSIISQCDNSAFAFFKPDKLVARKNVDAKEENPAEPQAGDMTITLKGQFIARQP